jgi:ABC-type uncharacterized transport system permease subunit
LNLRRLAESVALPLLAVVGALVVGGMVMASSGMAPLDGFSAILYGALGTPSRLGATLNKSIPLILVGLAVALPWRCGLLNIGGEGQIYMGGLAATLVALNVQGLPWAAHAPLVILAGFAGGALWAAIPGWLRARLKMNELITTIMLNYVAFWIVSYLVHGVMKDPAGGGYPWSVEFPATASLPILLPAYRVHLGLALALAAALVAHFGLWHTVFGLEVRMAGDGPELARLAGIKVERTLVAAMAIGGGLAGLAGMAEIAGVQHRLSDFFSSNYGFDAITVAMVAGGNPLGVILAGLFFGVLRTGADSASRAAGMPASISSIIQAVALLFLVAGRSPVLVRALARRQTERKVHVRDTQPSTAVN